MKSTQIQLIFGIFTTPGKTFDFLGFFFWLDDFELFKPVDNKLIKYLTVVILKEWFEIVKAA